MFLSWIADPPHWLFSAPMAAGTWALGEFPDETQLEVSDGEEDDHHDAKSHVVLPQPPGGVIHALLLQKLLSCASAHKSSPAVTTEATARAKNTRRTHGESSYQPTELDFLKWWGHNWATTDCPSTRSYLRQSYGNVAAQIATEF